MTTLSIRRALIGASAIVALPTFAMAQETTQIPLEYIYQNNTVNRLGIWVGVNEGKARRFLFDTGSDQFNGAIGKDATAVPGTPLTFYGYGDGTYGYAIRKSDFSKLSYFDKNNQDTAVKSLNGSYQIASIEDTLLTKDSIYASGVELTSDVVCVTSLSDGDSRCYKPNELPDNRIFKQFYADGNARKKIQNGLPFEENDTFSGTFGAGDFLNKASLQSSPLSGMTKTGFVVAANSEYGAGTDASSPATPGCSPCAIVDLNANVRAQFKSVMPWGNQDRKDFVDKFPGDQQGNASTQFEGAYDLKVNAGEDNETVVADKVPVLLDTGTANSGTLQLGEDRFNELLDAKIIRLKQKEKESDPDQYEMDLSIAAPQGEDVFLQSVEVNKNTDKNDNSITFIAGLDFFRSQSVVYDFEKKITAYTPYFVSADNFTTDEGNAQLSTITSKMGNQQARNLFDDNGKEILGSDGKPVEKTYGMLGIAGVISGSGSLTLDSYTDVRMTNKNTYTGATIVNKDATLSLAGLGSIENSEKVAVDGDFDISEHGNFNPYWGISSSQNDARIRSLSGAASGNVELGARNLILTAASDTFAGVINDLDNERKNHLGGGLIVAGGVQALSGANNYTGMTTINTGAGLLLTNTASIAKDVTTSGLLGNDGQIGGLALASQGGIVAGSGSFGTVTVTDGGTIAPGSVLDPNAPIAALGVTGNFSQQAGSVYEAGLGKTSDIINVGGNAAIDGGAQIELVRQGAASVDSRYTLLTATGGVAGTYGGLTGTLATDSPFVDFELAYDPNNVFLDVNRSAVTFADVADTFNQRSVAGASEALGDGNAIHDNILFLTAQETRNAFDMLSGEIHASARGALIEDSHFVRDAASERIRSAFDGVGTAAAPIMAYGPGGPEAAPATTEKFAVWGRGFGAWGHLDGDGNAARMDRSTGGLIGGGDATVGDNWRLGLLAGYSHTSFDVDDRASSGSSDNYHLGLYAGTQRGNLGFRSGLAYTWHRLETQRSVVFPGFADSLSADYVAGTFQAFGELGYRIETSTASFEPYGNLAYVHLKTDGFSEKGGAAALSSTGESSNTTFTTLGVRANTDLQLGTVPLTARGGLGWRHAFGDVTPESALAFADGNMFDVLGTPIAEDAAVLEVGLDVNFTRNASVGLAYQGQIASDAQEHGFNARFNVRF